MITAPRFWWRARPGLAAHLLWPVAAVWGWKAASRMAAAPEMRADVPVICVGNFVVGGAGKTPSALALAGIIRRLGLTPGFLTRGYGGTIRSAHRVDGARDTATLVGDEPLLLAEAASVVVAPHRPDGAPLLLAAGADCIIMDDGFQNPSLAKDFSLVVVDGGAGIGNGCVMPAGPLRAPLAIQMPRADAVLVIGEGAAGDTVARMAERAGKPVLRGRLEAEGGPGSAEERRVLAFSGIGRPEKFHASLREAGFEVAAIEAFPDHHPYGEADAERLIARAAAEGLTLVTTAKDAVRLKGHGGARGSLAERARVLRVRLVFEDEPRLEGLIRAAIARKRVG
ncbi:MAG: tetraacyldisaccharide 4'-kinase [Bosea sp.]|nr:tetraacyldisaccharide 4'-kinase [Bosea sp. (in: a-proteobacteria)]